MKFRLSNFLCLLLCTISMAESTNSRIAAKINPSKMHLYTTIEEGGGTYSVLDNDKVVFAEKKELLIIKNDTLLRKIHCPSIISTFDINRNGNGIIVCDSIFYKVHNLEIEEKPIKITIPNQRKGVIIFRVDVLNDSMIRIILSGIEPMVFVKFDSLQQNKFIINSDSLSRFIVSKADYIGRFGDEYFFLDLMSKHQGHRIIAFKFENGKPEKVRSIDIGFMGKAIPMSSHVRFDEQSGLFYIMLLQQGNIIIHEFNIKDFAKK